MKKHSYKMPTFLEAFQSVRNQVETPKGGAHKDKSKYNRKQKHKQAWEG